MGSGICNVLFTSLIPLHKRSLPAEQLHAYMRLRWMHVSAVMSWNLAKSIIHRISAIWDRCDVKKKKGCFETIKMLTCGLQHSHTSSQVTHLIHTHTPKQAYKHIPTQTHTHTHWNHSIAGFPLRLAAHQEMFFFSEMVLSGAVHRRLPSVINCHNASKLTNGLCVKEAH